MIVVDSVADELMRLMEGQQAVKLSAAQAEQLQPVLLKNIDERGKGTVSRDWVGRDASKIAAAIGLNVPPQTRLLFVETPASHPFAVTELMMPVLPVVRVASVDDAIALAVSSPGRSPFSMRWIVRTLRPAISASCSWDQARCSRNCLT